MFGTVRSLWYPKQTARALGEKRAVPRQSMVCHGEVAGSAGFSLTSVQLVVLPATNGETHRRRRQRAFWHLATSAMPAGGDAETPASAALLHTSLEFRPVCRSGPIGGLPTTTWCAGPSPWQC